MGLLDTLKNRVKSTAKAGKKVANITATALLNAKPLAVKKKIERAAVNPALAGANMAIPTPAPVPMAPEENLKPSASNNPPPPDWINFDKEPSLEFGLLGPKIVGPSGDRAREPLPPVDKYAGKETLPFIGPDGTVQDIPPEYWDQAISDPGYKLVSEEEASKVYSSQKSTPKIIGEQIGEFGSAIKGAAGGKLADLNKKSSFEQFIQPAKDIGRLGKWIGGKLNDADQAAANTIGSIPDALSTAYGVTKQLAQGGKLSDPYEGNAKASARLSQVADEQKNAVRGVAELMPLGAPQIAAGLNRGSEFAVENDLSNKEGFVRGLGSGLTGAAGAKISFGAGKDILNKVRGNSLEKIPEINNLPEIPEINKVALSEINRPRLNARETRKLEKLEKKNPLGIIDSLAGVNTAEANAIKNFAIVNPSKMRTLISTAEKRLEGNLNISPTMEVANWTKDGIEKLKNIQSDLGKEIGGVKSNLSTTKKIIPLNRTRDNIKNFLEHDNIGVKLDDNGKIDFRGSIFENSKSDQKFVTQIIRDTKEDVPIDVLQRRLTRLANELYQGGARLEFTNKNIIDKLAENVRKSYRESINDFAKKTGNQKLIELNSKFSEISDVLYNVEKQLGEDGIKSSSKIRQAFSNTGQPLMEFFGELDKVGKKLDIKELQDILQAGDSAISMESALGTFAPTGIESVIGKGIKQGIFEKGKDLIVGSKLDALKRISSKFNKNLKKEYKPTRKLIKKLGIGGVASGVGYNQFTSD